MAQSGYTPIQIYYSPTSGSIPTSANLISGELALNIADGVLYFKDSAGIVSTLSGGGGGNGTNQVFVLNDTVVTGSYTFPTGKNAESVGPITINSGVAVTIPSGQRWVVL